MALKHKILHLIYIKINAKKDTNMLFFTSHTAKIKSWEQMGW